MKGKHLGEFEELVLLSIGILADDAYSLSIMDELKKRTKRAVLISSVHKVLVRLEDKGLVKTRIGGATNERGGRAKKLYEITLSGKKAINESRDLRNVMWEAIPKFIWEGI